MKTDGAAAGGALELHNMERSNSMSEMKIYRSFLSVLAAAAGGRNCHPDWIFSTHTRDYTLMRFVKSFALLCLLALSFPLSALANYAFVNSATSTTASLTYSPTPGNYLVVVSMTSIGSGSPIASISDNGGGSWTVRQASVTLGDGNFQTVFTCGSAASGVTTITLAYAGGTPGTVALAVVEYSGLSPTGFLGISTGNAQTTPGTGANAVTTNSLTATLGSAPGAALIGWFVDQTGSAGMTAGTLLAFTRRFNAATNMIEDVRITSTGSYVATATTSHAADDFGSFAIAISEPGSGPTNGVVLSNGHPIRSGSSILYQ